jgi:hypothetical protein
VRCAGDVWHRATREGGARADDVARWVAVAVRRACSEMGGVYVRLYDSRTCLQRDAKCQSPDLQTGRAGAGDCEFGSRASHPPAARALRARPRGACSRRAAEACPPATAAWGGGQLIRVARANCGCGAALAGHAVRACTARQRASSGRSLARWPKGFSCNRHRCYRGTSRTVRPVRLSRLSISTAISSTESTRYLQPDANCQSPAPRGLGRQRRSGAWSR